MDKDNAAPSEKFLSGFGTSVGGGTPAYRRYAREAQKCYKPMTTRLPFLSGVLILTLALITMVEIVLRQYPVDNSLAELAPSNITRRVVLENGEDENIGIIGLRYESIEERAPSTDITESSTSSSLFDPYAGGTSRIILWTPSTSTTTTDAGGPTFTTIPGAYISPTTSESWVVSTYSAYTVDTAYLPSTTGAGEDVTPSITPLNGMGDPSTTVTMEPIRSKSFYKTRDSAYIPSTPSVSFSEPPNTTPGGYVPPTFTTTPGGYVPPTFATTSGGYIPNTPQASAPSIVSTITLPNGPQTTQSDGGENAPAGPGEHNPAVPTNGGVVTQISNIPTSTIVDPKAVDTSLVPVSTLISGGSAVVVLGTPSMPPLVPVSTYVSGGVAIVVMGSSKTSLVPVSTYTSNGATMVVMGLPTPTSLVPISTITTNGAAVVILGHPTSQPIPLTTSAISPSGSDYTVLVEPVTSTSGSIAYVYMTTITLGPGSQTSTAAVPHNTASTASDQQKDPLPFTSVSYFAAWYLPTMIAVAFRILWTIVYNNARLMEPFYRLASPSGVAGKHFLDTLYLSMGSIVPEPILALLSSHSYMLLVSGIAYLIELVAPLSSELLAVDVHDGCTPGPDANSNHPCPPRLIVHLIPARLLQGLLCLIAAFIILTIYLSRHRPSGVYSDPSSIAVLASLLHHPEIVHDFRRLGPSGSGLEQDLNEQTYKLAHYQAKGEGMKYGIVPVTNVAKYDAGSKGAYSAVENPEGGDKIMGQQHRFRRHMWRTLGDISLAILLLGSLGVTVAYYLDASDDGFNRFFNSRTFGPKFVVVFAAGIVVSQWKRLEKEVRTLEPYRRLSSSTTSSPRHTILLTTTSTPWSTLPLAIGRFEFFISLISLCYILSEILVIIVATIPFSTDEYWLAYLAGTYITFSILGIQILVFTIMMTWWRWTGPRLARDPDTLLGVWALLAASEIRQDFDDLGTAGRHDLVNTVMAWDKRYWLGEVVGKDGVARMGIHSDTERTDYDDIRFESLGSERPGTLSPTIRHGSVSPPPTIPFGSLPPTIPQITISPFI